MSKNKKRKNKGKRKGTRMYNTTPVPIEVKKLVKKRQNYHCACCGRKYEYFILEVHHIKRRRDGGSNDLDNLVAVCANDHKLLHHFDKYNVTKPPLDYGKTMIHH